MTVAKRQAHALLVAARPPKGLTPNPDDPVTAGLPDRSSHQDRAVSQDRHRGWCPGSGTKAEGVRRGACSGTDLERFRPRQPRCHPAQDMPRPRRWITMPAAEPEQRLTEREMAYALYLLKVHMPLLSPGAKVCRNCGWPMPCPTRRLTHQLLVAWRWPA